MIPKLKGWKALEQQQKQNVTPLGEAVETWGGDWEIEREGEEKTWQHWEKNGRGQLQKKKKKKEKEKTMFTGKREVKEKDVFKDYNI